MAQTIGNRLEEARVRREETVPDVAHATRISESLIRAMEADDFTAFQDMGYARRFLVLYAEHLGLEVDQFVAALSESKPARRSSRPLDVPVQAERIPIVKGVPVPIRRSAKSILTPLGALIILLLLPSAFLLGKRVGENRVIRESREARQAPPATPPVADGSGSAASGPFPPSGG